MTRQRGRTGLLVIRIWVEAGSDVGIRARITRTLDLEAERSSVVYASSIEDVAAAVSSWLRAFVAATSSPDESDGTSSSET
jgi:hypothetical protein